MIIDTHCHYNLEPLASSFDQEWKKAQTVGVSSSIIVGTDIDNSKLALEQSLSHHNLFATIGLHPGNYSEYISSILDGDKINQELISRKIDTDLSELTTLLEFELKKSNSKLVAIGEVGLDYYRLRKKGLKRELVIKMQQKIFKLQLELAVKHNLTVILHVRDQLDRKEVNAYYDTLSIIKEVFTKLENQTTLILHCASGPSDYIKQAISLGAYVGVAGNVTYDNAPEIKAIIKSVVVERLLLETDAPYLAPAEHKGGVCSPAMIIETAKFLQTEMSINLDIINNNTLKVFPKIAKAIE